MSTGVHCGFNYSHAIERQASNAHERLSRKAVFFFPCIPLVTAPQLPNPVKLAVVRLKLFGMGMANTSASMRFYQAHLRDMS